MRFRITAWFALIPAFIGGSMPRRQSCASLPMSATTRRRSFTLQSFFMTPFLPTNSPEEPFFFYQSTTYLVLYHGTDGQLFTHFQAVPMAIAYALVTLIAIATSVPIWGAMGLL